MKTRTMMMILAALMFSGVVALTGCEKKSEPAAPAGALEKAGAAGDKAAAEGTKAAESAGDAVKEATEGK